MSSISASASTSGYLASQNSLAAASPPSTLSTLVVDQQAQRRADCLAAAERRMSFPPSSLASVPTPSPYVSSCSSDGTASTGAGAAGTEPVHMNIVTSSIGSQPAQSATASYGAAASTSQPAARAMCDGAEYPDKMDTDNDEEAGAEAPTASHLPTALLQLLQEYRPPPHNGTAWAACVVHAALLDCALQPVALPGAGVGLEAALAAVSVNSQQSFACRQGYLLPGLPAYDHRPATLPAVAQVHMFRMGAFLVVLGAECTAEGRCWETSPRALLCVLLSWQVKEAILYLRVHSLHSLSPTRVCAVRAAQ
jgi:hypothetical protein